MHWSKEGAGHTVCKAPHTCMESTEHQRAQSHMLTPISLNRITHLSIINKPMGLEHISSRAEWLHVTVIFVAQQRR